MYTEKATRKNLEKALRKYTGIKEIRVGTTASINSKDTVDLDFVKNNFLFSLMY